MIRIKGFLKTRSSFKYFYENLIGSENLESIYLLMIEIISINATALLHLASLMYEQKKKKKERKGKEKCLQ